MQNKDIPSEKWKKDKWIQSILINDGMKFRNKISPSMMYRPISDTVYMPILHSSEIGG
jgi:hypothetical protein